MTALAAGLEEAKERSAVNWPLVVAMVALIISIAGNVAVFAVGDSTSNSIKNAARAEKERQAKSDAAAAKLRRERRIQVGFSDFALCSNIYGEFYGAQLRAERDATLAHYRAILPDLPTRSLRLLLTHNLAEIQHNKSKFNPSRCTAVPSFQFIPPKRRPQVVIPKAGA